MSTFFKTIFTASVIRHMRSAAETFIAVFMMGLVISIESGTTLQIAFSGASLSALASTALRSSLKVLREGSVKK